MDQASTLELLRASFDAAVAAADPLKIVAAHLPAPPRGRTLVVGAGKAAASMAAAVERAWPADAPLSGVVITRYAHGMPTKRVRVVEAGHPVPDTAGEQAAADILAQVEQLGPDDLLLALVSGGGSSLLSLPVDLVPMADLKAVTRKLLESGAPITEMNIVRKHLSRIQGGRLALASRAPVCALVISDVAGDDPSAIASGPCSADASTYGDALAVLQRWKVAAPDAVLAHLRAGAAGDIDETPKPGDARLAHAQTKLIATAHASLAAAAQLFAARSITPVILGDTVTGEAREVARVYAALAREIIGYGAPFKRPVALISGGECTVTIRDPSGGGRGGRCAEFLLALAVELDGCAGVYALAADTDGIDGTETNAGASLAPDTLARARAAAVDPQRALDRNDAFSLFERVGSLIVTGPTRTNVNDYRVILLR